MLIVDSNQTHVDIILKKMHEVYAGNLTHSLFRHNFKRLRHEESVLYPWNANKDWIIWYKHVEAIQDI